MKELKQRILAVKKGKNIIECFHSAKLFTFFSGNKEVLFIKKSELKYIPEWARIGIESIPINVKSSRFEFAQLLIWASEPNRITVKDVGNTETVIVAPKDKSLVIHRPTSGVVIEFSKNTLFNIIAFYLEEHGFKLEPLKDFKCNGKCSCKKGK